MQTQYPDEWLHLPDDLIDEILDTGSAALALFSLSNATRTKLVRENREAVVAYAEYYRELAEQQKRTALLNVHPEQQRHKHDTPENSAEAAVYTLQRIADYDYIYPGIFAKALMEYPGFEDIVNETERA